MIYKTAKTSLSIRIVTSLVIMMAVGFIVGAMFDVNLIYAGVFVGIISFLCYLFAPVAYDISGGQLTVLFRVGKKFFGPVTTCERITEKIPFTLRLFGNGGLFAGTGIFWNKRYGVFRAYVTSARQQDAVLVRTRCFKILITPDDPLAFVQSIQTVECEKPTCSESIIRPSSG
ncbi:MAG: PH domain-containing protein [Kiritimatiellae bacterium]|nr:PH domain-containing protein [Kiritimatiellia bacterium]MDD5520602.1 PH domain-containing protein [Kiritimatiellia bacterium]